jgi:hypothetical protein
LAGNDIDNELDISGEPKMLQKHYDDRRMLNDLGDEPIWTRMGVMITEGDPLRSDNSGGQTFGTDPPYTIILWVYVTKYDQDGCLFGKVDIENSYNMNTI